MSPEVGLGVGHGLEADVYSFGILLWEICALKKPFGNIKTSDEITKKVIKNRQRPKVRKNWPQVLKDTMQSCWSTNRINRPTMEFVKTALHTEVRELSSSKQRESNGKVSRRSWVFRRFTD